MFKARTLNNSGRTKERRVFRKTATSSSEGGMRKKSSDLKNQPHGESRGESNNREKNKNHEFVRCWPPNMPKSLLNLPAHFFFLDPPQEPTVN